MANIRFVLLIVGVTFVSHIYVSGCVDKVGQNGISDCLKSANLCNNAAYYDFMTQQCPKTCGRCPPTPESQTCVDKVGSNGTSDCARNANLCNNAAYYDLMTQQCPKTCKRC